MVNRCPLRKTQSLRTAPRVDTRCFKPRSNLLCRTAQAAAQCIVQLLPLLAEPGPHDLEEPVDVVHIDGRTVEGPDTYDRRIDPGGWVESTRRDAGDDLGLAVELDADREEAHIARPGDQPLRDLPLHGEHRQGGPDRGFEDVAQHCRGNVVW